ncbi:MAG TPA: 3-isopropylmalate dehydratase small subunit [Clostridium sp.]|jgi:3-isopropylmalate dehydratase small subunit|nr:3-isopropylmalate dehydratase small subunit [Clostridium sp.]HBK68142.1 3-isopropylmalate dehydratase small subunit [Bacillota bacterium]HBT17584.1 3-isopropylmalate dehydratase small subunit [Bacillota bacterium]
MLEGKVWRFGNDVDTDLIIPARYLNTSDPQVLAEHCLEDLEPGFARKVISGDIIVAGTNFGCGSSREHAPIALKASGVSCVIAASFARIFYRNALNIGLPILESVAASKEVKQGDILRVNFETGLITNLTRNQVYQTNPFPGFMRELIASGGLIPYLRKNLSGEKLGV